MWTPLPAAERCQTLDLLRGFALFGVLMVNLLDFFRVSLFYSVLHFHTHEGWANHAVDNFISGALEFKAFELFSLTFGMGVAVQAERARARGVNAEAFLVRRFLILLVFGVAHLVLVSNVDILTLYALCGLMLIAFVRLPAGILAVLGLSLVFLPTLLPLGPVLPSASVLEAHAAAATQTYSHGSFLSILVFRWNETRQLIAPLLENVAQTALGLMLTGMGLWRSGLVKDPERFRVWLWVFCLTAGLVGVTNRLFHVPVLHRLGPTVPLAFAYGAAILAGHRAWRGRAAPVAAPLAAMGQMALTNYLMQTIVFALLFYGFGLGLMGRLSPVEAAALGILFYAAQLRFSLWWLRRYRFGPFEWLWRSASYGRRQPL